MFKTILIKEIQETVYNFRFLISTLLCLILVPLGMFVSLKDYEGRLYEYQREVQLYLEQSEGNLRRSFIAQGFRPPSPLSVFSRGFDENLPQKVVVEHDVPMKLEYKVVNENSFSSLFGEIDFVYIVSYFVSLMALIFTFGCIASEKESGTIRLLMSNSLPRWKIIIAKLVGNYFVFTASFLIALILALLILNTSNVFSLFLGEVLTKFCIILLVTLLFIFMMFNLGIWISTITRNSISSMVILLFVWFIFSLVVPKISPMISQILYPIKTQQQINDEIKIVRQNLNDELEAKEIELYARELAAHNVDLGSRSRSEIDETNRRNAMKTYDEAIAPVLADHKERTSNEIAKIENLYNKKKNIQMAITMNLSRLSPVSCFTYIISEFSSTGIAERRKFYEYAQRFQNTTNQELYDNYITRVYRTENSTSMYGDVKDGLDYDTLKNLPVPQLEYDRVTVREAVRVIWIDIVLLCFFCILFFTLSFVSFLKYDVR